MKRRALAACLALGLSACASAPKKPAADAAGPAGLPAQRGRSPYAPAQEDPGKRGHYTRGGLYAPHIKDSVPDELPDVDRIPEPEVVDEPRSRYGNRSPYQVLGKTYEVRDSAAGYLERGLASYYGNKFHGRRTSNLEVYDMYAFTAAHRSLPLPSFARVTNLDNGKSVVVRVNDRGPFHGDRLIDLSYAAAVKLGYRDTGTARVEVRGLSPGENAREPYDAVAEAEAPAPSAAPVAQGSAALRLPPGVRIATGKPARPAGSAAAAPPATAMDKLVGLLPVVAAGAAERAPRTSAPAAPAPGREWRFDMLKDGKAMTADEFDAWMRSRRARVATGRPAPITVEGAGKPGPDGVAAPRVRAAAGDAPPAPRAAAAAVAAQAPADGGRVVLQVASFANRQNAGHALALLQQAAIDGARLQDALVDGRQVWRLRVGPVDAARAPELAARVVGLGFGQPQRVRD